MYVCSEKPVEASVDLCEVNFEGGVYRMAENHLEKSRYWYCVKPPANPGKVSVGMMVPTSMNIHLQKAAVSAGVNPEVFLPKKKPVETGTSRRGRKSSKVTFLFTDDGEAKVVEKSKKVSVNSSSTKTYVVRRKTVKLFV
jgi:hypothetical protein